MEVAVCKRPSFAFRSKLPPKPFSLALLNANYPDSHQTPLGMVLSPYSANTTSPYSCGYIPMGL